MIGQLTIPCLTCRNAFFNKQGIDFFYQTANTFLYVNSIDNLTDSAENRGWLFTIDGQQPQSPSMKSRFRRFQKFSGFIPIYKIFDSFCCIRFLGCSFFDGFF
ncbi:DUF4430 domain-containing protein [Secundilactobacillus kimchicus]|uniref:DUF4430 domain-containing protein n=1 Tax=Secundilactobacillus kimchicus TaxID=528209 RepID=UPI0034E5AA22